MADSPWPARFSRNRCTSPFSWCCRVGRGGLRSRPIAAYAVVSCWRFTSVSWRMRSRFCIARMAGPGCATRRMFHAGLGLAVSEKVGGPGLGLDAL